MFKSVPNRFNVTLLEEEVLRIWNTHHIFEKRRILRQDAPPFRISVRPPVTVGKPDLHDALTLVHQDMWLRYKTMRGLRAQRFTAWNTHGLPVELQAENRLGLTGKAQIDLYGLAHFNDFCRQLAVDSIQIREALVERLGGWTESNPAPTSLDNHSVEAVWGLFRQAWDKGLLYQEERVLPYCPRCGTLLAEYEVAPQTVPIDSTAVFVRLPLLEDPGTSLLVWTAHAWSLPGNVAVAANPDAEYVIVERELPEGEAGKDRKTEKLILARALLNRIFGEEAIRVYETFRGSKLRGLRYRPLFQFLVADKPAYRVVMDNFVVSDTGSGLVQLVPAFDAHDLQLAKQNDLPVLVPIGEDGTFNSDVRPWRGMFFKDAETYIQQELLERGLLYLVEPYRRNAAFCWGCGSPLLPYIRNTWYLRTQDQAGDWALGRERYWGTPLPIWQCIQCAHQVVVSSLEELSHLAGRSLSDMDLHRPAVDEVAFSCPKCDGLMRRLPQVLDAGFDAAVLSLHQTSAMPEQSGPVNLVCEVNGLSEPWLYALHHLHHLLSTVPAYQRLVSLPRLVEDDERTTANNRQSLSDPWDVVHDHGADALRWVFISACSSGDQVAFSDALLDTAWNDFILPLWGTYAGLVNSAVRVGWSPALEATLVQYSSHILDRWLFSCLHLLIKEATAALEDYDGSRAARLLQEFVVDLSDLYMPLAHRRFIEKPSGLDHQAAFSTLYRVLVTLSQLLAPFIPFLSDELYQKLVRSFDLSEHSSVHLTDWPVSDEALIDGELNHRMALLHRIASLGQSAREADGVALFQPLAGATVALSSPGVVSALQPLTDLLATALRVRSVSYVVDESLTTDEVRLSLDPRLTVELVQEGLAEEFIRHVQEFRQKAGFSHELSIRLFVNATPRLAAAIRTWQSHIMDETFCLEIKLVSELSTQQPGTSTALEQGRSSRRLYTMVELDGERLTFGIEKAIDQ